MEFEPVIGLEIHVQLKTKSKLFCSSPNDFAVSAPNTNICEICTGQPGTLPVLNSEALKKAVIVGLALNCEIASNTKFDRKNYFYPDLPKGYQISQYVRPINGRGHIEIDDKAIRITRAHLEEDAGKLLHGNDGKSYVDFNRAGVPLLEIVTEPDFESPAQEADFLRMLRITVRYLDVSDADMEKGHLRVDANISIRKVGERQLPSYKVEVKNMNSFKAVEAALNFEIQRQTKMLESGEYPINETRGYVDADKSTTSLRTKEAAHDYRYFPEPDLPPIVIPKEYIGGLRSSLPELPTNKVVRFSQEYGLSEGDCWQIIEDKSMANYFENAVSELQEWVNTKEMGDEAYKKAAKNLINWLLGDYLALVNRDAEFEGHGTKITAENFAEFVTMIEEGTISTTAGKTVLVVMYATGGDPSNIVEEKNLGQVNDTEAIEQAVDKVITENPEVVEKYKSGKIAVIGVLVGQAMKEMDGRANPAVINEILQKKLT